MPADSASTPRQQSGARREEEFVGQELHDTVCQTLAGVSLMLSSLTRRQQQGKETAREDLEKIRSNVDAASEQLRLIFESTLLERHPQRLLPMLERLASATAMRVPCHLSADDAAETLDGPAAYAFYRTARVFIHVAIRAGGASEIAIRLTTEKKKACLQLSFEGVPVLSPSFSSDDEKLLEEAMTSGFFQWRIEAGTQLVCGPH